MIFSGCHIWHGNHYKTASITWNKTSKTSFDTRFGISRPRRSFYTILWSNWTSESKVGKSECTFEFSCEIYMICGRKKNTICHWKKKKILCSWLRKVTFRNFFLSAWCSPETYLFRHPNGAKFSWGLVLTHFRLKFRWTEPKSSEKNSRNLAEKVN